MSQIYQLFFRGLFTLLPIFLTLYIIHWFFSSIEELLSRHVVSVIPDAFHFPGIGIATAIVVVVAVGFFMKIFAGGKVFHFIEEQFRKVPVIGAVYGFLKDLTKLFGSGPDKEMKRVVLVKMPAFDSKMMGFVTRDHFEDLPEMGIPYDSVAVYISGTYFFGGITMFFRKDQVEELDISPEQALKLVLTGWIKGDLKKGLASYQPEESAQDKV